MPDKKHKQRQMDPPTPQGDEGTKGYRKSILQLSLLASLLSALTLLVMESEMAGIIIVFVSVPLVLEILAT
jgi:hypothetical protein